MKKSSFIISIILHLIVLSIHWEIEYNKKNDKLKNKNKVTKINILLKDLRNKDVIELKKYNNRINKNAKFISLKNNFTEKDIQSEKSDINNPVEKKITLKGNLNKKQNKKNDKKNDNKTNVSTIEFAYFEYYKKMKSIVDEKWDKIIKDKKIEILGEKNETFVLLKISSEGKILSKKIDKTSGIISVDFAALETFNGITLPKPPKEILRDKDFLFIQWGFSLKSVN